MMDLSKFITMLENTELANENSRIILINSFTSNHLQEVTQSSQSCKLRHFDNIVVIIFCYSQNGKIIVKSCDDYEVSI